MQEPKIVVVSGEFGSGKTLFGLTTGHPPDKTLVFDLEKSSIQYQDMGFVRVDLPQVVMEAVPAWKPTNLWEAFTEQVQSIEPGEYDVIVIDPVSELELGLADWVLSNPSEFNHSAAQYASASGIYWGDVKALEKRILLDLAARCNTLIVTAHMRDQWRGNNPTGRRERKGKDTLTEISDLELLLERKPNQQVPSARVVRCRMVWINPDDPADIRSALPPRLPQATWKAIRHYMEEPPKWGNLKDEEKVESKPLLSDEERLLLEVQVAQARSSDLPLYNCTQCGEPIEQHRKGNRTWTPAEIIGYCEGKGLPLMCASCGNEHIDGGNSS